MGTNGTGCAEWERDFDPKTEQPRPATAHALTEPSVANLRKAATAIYVAVEKTVADDISNLLQWAANEIERLRALAEKDGAT